MPLVESQPDAVAYVYARSLFDLAMAAGGRGKVEEVTAEIEDILEIARGDSRFAEFLSSRSLAAEARGRSIEKIFKGRVSDLTVKFLLLLNEKGRIGHLPAIASAFDSVVQEKFGRLEVDVYTAAPLDDAELDGVKKRLQATLGKEVVVHPYTDATMIGGVRFQIGDQLVDASLSTRLRRMKDQLDNDGIIAMRSRIAKIIGGEN